MYIESECVHFLVIRTFLAISN